MNFVNFFFVLEKKFETFKNECNVTNFRYVFVTRFHVILTNYSGYWMNFLIFFSKTLFLKMKKKKTNWENSYRFWRINKFIRNKKQKRAPDYLLDNHIFYRFANNFLILLLCKINIFDILNKVNAPVCDPVSVCGHFLIFSFIDKVNDKKLYDNHYKHYPEWIRIRIDMNCRCEF